MLLQRMIVRLRGNRATVDDRTILEPHELRRLLVRERARTDRTGRPFCLMTFVPRDELSVESFKSLLKILDQRLRITDEVGMLDSTSLAVVLPETPAEGAWKVADDVLAAYPTSREPPLCEVFCYPSDLNDAAEESASDNWADQRRSAQPMEHLFMRRMPLWKRALDILGASSCLLMVSPLLLISAAAIKLTSPGPVIFQQWRSGAGRRPFLMFKLRTMTIDAEHRKQELQSLNEQDGPAFKIKADPRVTRVGRLLRKTSIDELPQLWNVLKGEMSLVGPRPLPCNEAAGCAPWQQRRLDVKPGLTCIWQVSGRSRVTFDEWIRMDLRYIRMCSLLCDLKLIAQTATAVLFGRGAH